MTAARMQQRRDTAANWTAANPVLAAGEIGWESDTGRVKFGDGVTAWNVLAAFAPSPAVPITSQTEYDADGAIAFDALFNTAIFQGAAPLAMTLATPTLAENGRRLRLIVDTPFEVSVTTATDKLQGSTGGSPPIFISGNRITIAVDSVARWCIELEANAERWIMDGFPSYYGEVPIVSV